jgi:pimeloyl-ACP methyl ester carboxylesterase
MMSEPQKASRLSALRIFKILALGVAGMVLLIGIVVGGALGVRAYRQHQNGQALAIHTPHGIDRGLYVQIGGLRQWLQIRGEDQGNPVLLFVHGGPALSMIPFTYRSMRPWEKYYTIVSWDQRGAGRTYFLNGGADETATGMDQIIADGIQVAELTRAMLHKDRIIVLGESFGSAVALEMARRRPDLFYAFVGTGQSVDMRRAEVLTYSLLLQQVRTAHDATAIAQLLAVGPPPYTDPARRAVEQRIEGAYPGEPEGALGAAIAFAPGYSLRESFELLVGATQHRSRLVAEDMNYDARRGGTRFEVPVFFFQGSADLAAPLQLAAEYMNEISAPRKALVIIPGGGHNAYILHSERFLDELNARVRPLALSSQ